MTKWLGQAWQAIRLWNRRQWLIALAGAVGSALLIGVATVLIPNPMFRRDIATVWWNYPVWIVTSILMGLLIATYARGESDTLDARTEKRTTGFGMVGGALAWFAVGCPVCNKLALLAFGYSGAITWFAPMQPFLAVIALVLTGAALLIRLRGQVECPLPAR